VGAYASPALRHLHGTLLLATLSGAPSLSTLAPKLTGMLLELPPETVSSLLADSEALGRAVDEALDVLREASDPRALVVPSGAGGAAAAAAAAAAGHAGPWLIISLIAALLGMC